MTEDGSMGQVVKSEPAIKHISEFFGGGSDLSNLNVYCYDQESAFRALAALQSDDVDVAPIQL